MATANLTEHIPPHSIEAEQALLGAIFLDRDVLNDVVGVVKNPDQFYRTAHGLIYGSMLRLFEQGKEIDWVTVKEDLARHGELEMAGDAAYLEELTEATPTSAGAHQYAEVVRDKAILRAIIKSASEVRGAAYDPTSDPRELIEQFEREVFRLGSERFSTDSKSVLMLLEEVRRQMDYFRELRISNNSVPGLPCGFKDVDRITTGFKGGELIVLAARPGHGKTSLALNIAEKVALGASERRTDGRGGAVFFSLEMTGVELVSRVLCCMAGVSLKKVRLGELKKSEEQELDQAQEALAGAPLFVDDSFVLSMPEIRAKSRRLKDRHGIELVVVDYLQLVQSDSRLDRHEQIGVVSRGLKALARELDVPVIALAQLNRSIEQRRGVQQRPMLSDLRESGSIEQDADMVMFIQRDRMLDAAKLQEAQVESETMSHEDREQFLDSEPASLIIAKNRSGPTGDVALAFRRSCTRFEAAHRTAEQHFTNR